MSISLRGISIFALTVLALVVVPVGCLESGEKGSAEVTVSTQALSAADVAKITVSVTGDGIAEPIVHDLVNQGGQFQGIIGEIPAGAERTFHADAFDDADALIYAGEVTGVTIEHEVRAAVFILLQQSTPPDPFENSVPRIDGLSASATVVASGETVSLSVSFHDPDPADAPTLEWTATCGSFDDGSSSTPLWTAPIELGSCEVTVTVSDGRGGVASASLTLQIVEGWGEAQVLVEVNTWPVVSSVTATPGRLDVGETTAILLEVSDTDEDDLTFSWSDGGGECAGAFSDDSAQNPSWTAPASYPSGGQCLLMVTINDGRGGSTTGRVMVHVVSPLLPNIAPVIDSWFMSIDVVEPGETIVLRVDAHDPESSPLVFSWLAVNGTLGVQVDTATRSEIEWTAPASCAGEPFVINSSVSDAEGLETEARFTVACDGAEGWIVYTSPASGVLEIWAARDDGSSPVQITEGLSDTDDHHFRAPKYPAVSWDGLHIAVMAGLRPDGGYDEVSRIYSMDTDGSNLQFVVQQGLDGRNDGWHGFGWELDNRHILYTRQIICDEDIYRVDALDPGPTTFVHDGRCAIYPRPNPVDSDRVLYHDRTCGTQGDYRQVELSTGIVDVLVPSPTATLHAGWARDGARFTFKERSSQNVWIYDTTTSESTLAYVSPPEWGVGGPVFGNGDSRLYALVILEDDTYDVLAIDLATGDAWPLGLNVDDRMIVPSWSLIPYDIDRDRDGLANGIDPTPDI